MALSLRVWKLLPLLLVLCCASADPPMELETKNCTVLYNDSSLLLCLLQAFKPPMQALAFIPKKPGSYPIVVFHHGFMLQAESYSVLLKDIATQGFIILAVKRTDYWKFNITFQLKAAAEFLDWLPANLQSLIDQCANLPSTVANLNKLVTMGHSKGGKIAFAQALGIVKRVNTTLSAVIGVDPVDGTTPAVVGSKHRQLSIPALTIGSGLGPNGPIIPCAPRDKGYKAFFRDVSAPVSYLFMAAKDGHMDFLNDGAEFWRSWFCPSGSRERARKIASTVAVAFLKATLLDDCSELDNAVLGDDFVEAHGNLTCSGPRPVLFTIRYLKIKLNK